MLHVKVLLFSVTKFSALSALLSSSIGILLSYMFKLFYGQINGTERNEVCHCYVSSLSRLLVSLSSCGLSFVC